MSFTTPDIATQQALRRQKMALFRRLQHNLFYKCVSVLSAIILFVFVQTEHNSNPPLSRNMQADVVYLHPPPNLDKESLRSQVAVTVVGPRMAVESLRPNDVTATADLSNHNDESDLPQVVTLTYGLRSSVPEEVASQIRFDVKQPTLKIPLYANITRQFNVTVPDIPAPAGYRFGVAKTDPARIDCQGRKDRVDQVERLVPDIYSVAKLISAKGDQVRGRVAVIPLDRDGNYVPGVTLVPKTISLQLPRIKDLLERNVTVTVPIAPPLPPWTIDSVEVNPPMVKVRGLADQIQPLYTVSTEPFALPAGETHVVRTCIIQQPAGVLVYNARDEAIREVRVTITLHRTTPAPAPPADPPSNPVHPPANTPGGTGNPAPTGPTGTPGSQ